MLPNLSSCKSPQQMFGERLSLVNSSNHYSSQPLTVERVATLDAEIAANHLAAYAQEGFDTFDMADHYGSAEIITGRLLKRYPGENRPVAFTKWCPEPGPMTADVVRAGVQERLARLAVNRVDLLQFHWWTFEHPAWLDAAFASEKARVLLMREGLILVEGSAPAAARRCRRPAACRPGTPPPPCIPPAPRRSRPSACAPRWNSGYAPATCVSAVPWTPTQRTHRSLNDPLSWCELKLAWTSLGYQ